MPRKNKPGKGSGLAHTVADHGRRITKAEKRIEEHEQDINALADEVLAELPDAASGNRPRRRRKKRL